MNTYYKNDLNKALMIIEGDGELKVDYQTCMLQENIISGLLKTDIRYVDNKSCYHYDVSGKVSLQSKYEREKLRDTDIIRLIKGILAAVKEVKRYMLDGKGILLDPEYIYCEGEQYFFAYYPPYEQEITEKFHRLTEFFVREVDYQDKEGVHLAYTLHRASMEENYSIEKIMEMAQEERVQVVHYERQMEERMDSNLQEEMAVAEEKNFWEPVRRFIERRKREKWS